MSKFEHKPGQFTFFSNEKTENPKAPTHTGRGLYLDGTPIRIAVWGKEGKNGKFFSCVITEDKFNKDASKVSQAPKAREEKRTIIDDLNDDMPF